MDVVAAEDVKRLIHSYKARAVSLFSLGLSKIYSYYSAGKLACLSAIAAGAVSCSDLSLFTEVISEQLTTVSAAC